MAPTLTDPTTTSADATVWPQVDGWLPITPNIVERIVDIDDPALRNLWITATYADFAHRLLPFLGDDQTWCTFAIWASNTVGVSIRQDEVPATLKELLGDAPHHVERVTGAATDHHRLVAWLIKPFQASHLDRLVRQALDQVSEHMAHGNTIVYAQLAPLFIRLIEHLEHHGAPEPSEIDALLDAIGVPTAHDEPMLRQAFTCYAHATTADEAQRAQLVLTANIAAVLHEQRRLQPDLAAALDSALIDIAGDVDRLMSRFVPAPLRRLIVRATQARVAAPVEALWGHVATRFTMTLVVPGQTLHLNVDVPAPAGRPLFAPPLDVLDQSPLLTLMREWDPTDGTGIGSAAYNWADLHDRMGYIVNMFRSRQRMVDLAAFPFTPAQLAAMASGQLPGDLSER